MSAESCHQISVGASVINHNEVDVLLPLFHESLDRPRKFMADVQKQCRQYLQLATNECAALNFDLLETIFKLLEPTFSTLHLLLHVCPNTLELRLLEIDQAVVIKSLVQLFQVLLVFSDLARNPFGSLDHARFQHVIDLAILVIKIFYRSHMPLLAALHHSRHPSFFGNVIV
mmetsp:Transcript_22657/g.52814  ORF Transcript_22657/g.52814 Transcript_22657/m.52814 type:complete len:172 (+) Transcript_22657:3934-4449(+)